MPNGEKKGISVRIDEDLHAEVSQYLRDHGLTMAEFVTRALDDELHPKNQMKEGNTMENMKTIAVQVPEDLFQRIKDYLQRNNMTQKQFLIGLIEDELERDQAERESQDNAVSDDPDEEDDPEFDEDDPELDEDDPEFDEDDPELDEDDSEFDEDDNEFDEDDPEFEPDDEEDESEDETRGVTMGM